jgi:hypothetical protein
MLKKNRSDGYSLDRDSRISEPYGRVLPAPYEWEEQILVHDEGELANVSAAA